MTELLLLLAFLESISLVGDACHIGLGRDIAYLKRITGFIDSAKANDYFANVITDLNRLDDAVVTGLSSKKPFSFESSVFKRKRNSVLPVFYYGPLSSVFDDSGVLRQRIDTVSVQFILESLRLVRRAKSKAFTKLASDKAASKFIAYQKMYRPGNDTVLDDLTTLWQLFEQQSDFLESIKYGHPGNGVTLDMRFPYVPDLCFLEDHSHEDPAVTLALTKAFENLDPTSCHTDRYFDHCISECPFAGRYSSNGPVTAKLSIVDKKFDEGRAITVTDTASTIRGAILRNSVFNHHRINGSRSMVNVHDQSSSHKVLEKAFWKVACVDLEGGSSCLTVENLDRVLSKTVFVGPLWKASRPSAFTWKRETFELTTLTMGDASSVALLTTTLWLALVLAYMRYNEIPLTPSGFKLAVRFMRLNDLFRTVGDDLIFPDIYYNLVVDILTGLGVTINERKSSRGYSHHKESCGAWFVSNGLKHVRRIYPFRAAVSQQRDLPSVTQVIEQYIEKNEKSPFSKALFLAHTRILLPLDYRLEYEQLLAYHPSIVGTRFGSIWSHTYRTVRGAEQSTVADTLAYAVGLRDSLCTPRWNRRPERARFRVRKKSASLGSSRSTREHLGSAIAIRMLAKFTPGLLCKTRRPVSPVPLDVFADRRWNGYDPNPHYRSYHFN